ncbi:membrane protein [Klebsiella quasipneumoniae]|nr:membrane protein [Klebsiella quasipneumoniae]
MQSEPVVKDGLLSAFKMRWTMDEITSSDLLYDAGNAKPGSEVWKKLAAEVMANVLGQHYYVDMFYDKDSDFSLPAALQAVCKATVMTPKPNDKMLSYAQSLDKADAPPEDMALGSYFAQKVTLTCQ